MRDRCQLRPKASGRVRDTLRSTRPVPFRGRVEQDALLAICSGRGVRRMSLPHSLRRDLPQR